MILLRTPHRFSLLLLSLAALVGIAAWAGGPLRVGGTFGVEGQAFRWNIDPVTYWTDQGDLGTQVNADADILVAAAFQVWQDVPTATITFSAAGELGADVNATNILAVLSELANCAAPLTIARDRSIIYDVDGSAVEALGEDPNLVVGFALAGCESTDGINNSFERGLALLNGKFIDGQPPGPTNPEISLTEFEAAFIHEFGHLIGLDHTQINLNCLTSFCGADDLEGVPTMFPALISLEMATLSTDDIAAVSELYPAATFTTTTGRIQGQILFSDGVTPAQGFNVIARQVDDPVTDTVDESRRIAVSSVSGFLFTACEGNPVSIPGDCSFLTFFGSRDQTLIGFYEIPGLPPDKSYTIEVEAIDPGFIVGSGVGPIGELGFQFPLPGPPEFHTLGESDTDDPAAPGFEIPLTAGGVEPAIDIILNGTPPRFDAWETAWMLMLQQFWARVDHDPLGSGL